ncbi:MAG: zinc-ribbon domain-containing protein [Alphaproteobacteria bacterium]
MDNDGKMHIVCGKCQTEYRLDPQMLGGPQGRTVRCQQCKNTWHQDPPEGFVFTAPPEQPPQQAAQPKPDWMEDEPKEEISFERIVKGQYVLHDDIQVVPEAVLPTIPKTEELPPLLHKPFGMEAQAFGAAVFLLLCFVSLSFLMLAKQPLVAHYPSMIAFYDKLGVHVSPPGEGLAFSGLIAESHVADDGARKLSVEAKLANLTKKELPYPAIRIAVKGAYGTTLKEWKFAPDAGAAMGVGGSAPVKMQFADAPAEGKTVEIRVVYP